MTSSTSSHRLIVAVLLAAVAILGGVALYEEYGPGGTEHAASRISPSTSAIATTPAGDGGACALISAALDRPGQDNPSPEEVAKAAAAAEAAPDPRISALAGVLSIRAEMAIKARYAADGPTRLGELAAAAAGLRLACVQALYS